MRSWRNFPSPTRNGLPAPGSLIEGSWPSSGRDHDYRITGSNRGKDQSMLCSSLQLCQPTLIALEQLG
jgi:hypothetical protein